ncbi:MAG TPA: type II secretion system protein [Gammaproteobacteria bacterium]|nr:type II secretion system protein [Gammaproteobacteria bacterium]
MKKQSGFTLIELVMVIVILGILAATALPKFADLTGDARQASVEGLLGAVNSTMAIVHAQALVDNVATSASGDSVTIEGQTINLVYGYPDDADIDNALNFSTDFTFAATGTSSTFTLQTNCLVTYNEATSATVPATASVTVSGC